MKENLNTKRNKMQKYHNLELMWAENKTDTLILSQAEDEFF